MRVTAGRLAESNEQAKSRVIHVRHDDFPYGYHPNHPESQEMIAFGKFLAAEIGDWKRWAYVPVDSRARELVGVQMSQRRFFYNDLDGLYPFLPSCEIVNRREGNVCCALYFRCPSEDTVSAVSDEWLEESSDDNPSDGKERSNEELEITSDNSDGLNEKLELIMQQASNESTKKGLGRNGKDRPKEKAKGLWRDLLYADLEVRSGLLKKNEFVHP